MISSLALAGMACSAVLAIGFPVALLLIWRKKTHAPVAAAAVGALMFLLFASVLEQLLHAAVLQPTGYVYNHAWAYVLYGTLAAGVFEETGRYVGFRFLLKKRTDRCVGVMYGIGHGGIEAILIGGMSAVSNLIFSLQINSGALAGNSTYAAAVKTMQGTAPGLFFVSGLERVVAVCLHIALSVLVFMAVNRAGRRWLYPFAILLHAAVDAFAALYQAGVLTSILLVEVCVTLVTAAIAVYAARLYRDDQPEDSLSETVQP